MRLTDLLPTRRPVARRDYRRWCPRCGREVISRSLLHTHCSYCRAWRCRRCGEMREPKYDDWKSQ